MGRLRKEVVTMRLIADTHVHFYPCYDVSYALHSLRTNLSKLEGEAVCLAFLAERADCNFFSEFRKNVAGILSPKTEIRYLDNAICLREINFPDLYLFPGRQVITRERIEILSLTVDRQIGDGLPAAEVVKRIRQENGVPVLSWAPGKWFFKRKKVVQDLLDTSQPGSLLIGDTTLRPVCWPRPFLMRRAARKGLTVIAGSDPLPFGGEEKVMGRYGIGMDGRFDPDNPAQSIRALLTRPGLHPALTGKRGGILATLNRLARNAQEKKTDRNRK